MRAARRGGALRAACLVLLIVVGARHAAADAPPPARVLAVFECQVRQPICLEATQSIEAAFAASTSIPAELYFEYLDLSRLGQAMSPQSVSEMLVTKYARRPPSVVITYADPVAALIIQNRERLWPGVPIVAAALEREHPEFPPDVVQLATPRLNLAMAETVRSALAIVPGARQLVYVGGSGPTDRRGAEIFREQMGRVLPSVPYTELTGMAMPDLLARLAQLPVDSVVYSFGVFVDGSGHRFVPRASLEQIAAASNRPVFTLATTALGTGVVGGYLTDFGGEGRAAARAAIAAITGAQPSPPGQLEGVAALPSFDWRQLRRWGIDLSTLPAGSVLEFREPTFLERYWGWLVLAMAQGGLIVGLVAQGRHRRRATARARANESLNRSVMASLSGLIAVVDRNGTLIEVNAAWRGEAPGGPGEPLAGALPGRNCRTVCEARRASQTTASLLLEAIDRVLGEGQAESSFELAHQHHGEARWFRWGVRALDRPEGGAILSLTDVTTRKLAEIEGRRSLQEVAQALRVTTMGELGTSLAHEINQPLAAILTNAQAALKVLGRRPGEVEFVREVLEDIAGDARRAGEVIRRIRSMLRKDASVRVPVQVNTVVRDVLALLGPEAILRRVALEPSLAEDLPLVSGDPVQLQQVVLNLVANALDATSGAGRVDGRILVRTASGDGRVELRVEDDGPGIAPDVLPRIFEPFFTTKQTGLGMGLAIIRSIVDAHGGQIVADSAAGRGATFTCRLPALVGDRTE